MSVTPDFLYTRSLYQWVTCELKISTFTFELPDLTQPLSSLRACVLSIYIAAFFFLTMSALLFLFKRSMHVLPAWFVSPLLCCRKKDDGYLEHFAFDICLLMNELYYVKHKCFVTFPRDRYEMFLIFCNKLCFLLTM